MAFPGRGSSPQGTGRSRAANRHLGRRKVRDAIFYGLFLGSIVLGIGALAVLLIDILTDGLPWLTFDFITTYPSRHADESGIKAALYGSLWVVGLTGIISVPLGVATAIYLEEFAAKNWRTTVIQVNISNLAGVPSIIYGILGLAVFVQLLGLGRVVIAGALTMTLLVLPIVIVATQEAIKAVPDSYRNAGFAIGATRWQVVKTIVLPLAIPGIMSGLILALSRAIGESAPMIMISALVFLTFIPQTPGDRFTVMPIQIFNWVAQPQEDFRGIAAAGIIVLLVMLLTMNAGAIYIRNKYQRRRGE
ncbi:MAG: phosphate ABC transporter permease PstA [Chloroflexi bacterium]|nr:phosphate ABC transporter permease PstA [Chloroflexota bacterium]